MSYGKSSGPQSGITSERRTGRPARITPRMKRPDPAGNRRNRRAYEALRKKNIQAVTADAVKENQQMTTKFKAKFNPGQLVATPAFTQKVDPSYGMGALLQHLSGKWGVLDTEDWKANDYALEHGGRLFSSYPLPNEAGDFWIITEADRSVTTMLLPSDY